jgi:acetyl esterase
MTFCGSLRAVASAMLAGIVLPWCHAAGAAALSTAEARVYRSLSPVPLRLYVFKPKDWKAGDRRPALVWFFGGGWTVGTPVNSVAWASWAAGSGMVGVAPDYRVAARFGTTPLEAVADARAALRWVEDHAAELGIDSQRIVVGGNSAGGHLALWTAISHAPPGSDPGESPRIKPAAIILTSGVSDTSEGTGYTARRFGKDALALSPVHQLDAKMPPMLVFHGDADKGVPYRESVALHAKLVALGNVCELITVPGGSHNYAGDDPAWWPRTLAIARVFLEGQGLVPK